jgi:AhpD family alkylhydroperoxidase
MTPRFDLYKAAPQGLKPMLAMEAYFKECGLDQKIIELVKTRASQINGCAFCLDMHTSDARKEGESEIRLYMLPAWRESSRYTPKERAALAWTEALTLVSETHAPDEDYRELMNQFTEKEAADLTLLIGTINSWNRIAIGSRAVPLSERKQHAA